MIIEIELNIIPFYNFSIPLKNTFYFICAILIITNNPDNIIIKGDGNVIHHVNENHEDNRIENLQKMTRGRTYNFTSEGKTSLKKHKEKLSNVNKGKHLSKETKDKISETIKSKHPKGMLGKSHSDKTKEKISKSNKGRKLSKEMKEKFLNLEPEKNILMKQKIKYHCQK